MERTRKVTDRGTILVLGGTGMIGRRVAERLWDNGYRIRVASTDEEPRFEWTDWTTWAPLLDGAAAVCVESPADLPEAAAVAATRVFTDLAVRAGVLRLVMVSPRGDAVARACERVVEWSGVSWTLVRTAWPAQVFSEGDLRAFVLAGDVPLPAGLGAEAFVDAGDAADVVVAALTERDHARRAWELTGPRALAFAAALEEIARTTRRSIVCTTVAPDELPGALAERGVHAGVAQRLLCRFGRVADGDGLAVAHGVRWALRRAPRDFTEFVRAAALAGAWRAEGVRQPA